LRSGGERVVISVRHDNDYLPKLVEQQSKSIMALTLSPKSVHY
jgi:hypothetical protein